MADQATDQLTQRGLAMEDLAGYVRPLDDTECLLLVGSIADGLGNADSDVDLMLIGRRGQSGGFSISRPQHDIETVLPTAEAEVSVETFEAEQVSSLEPIMAAAAAAFENPEGADSVPVLNTQEEIKLLHRLATGIPLVNPGVVEQWRTRLRLDVFPEVFALGASILHFAHREDGLSHVLEDDYDTASVCFRSSASEAAAMLLASVGRTQPSMRWRFQVLRRHREELGAQHVDALIAAMLDRVSSREDVERLLTTFDAVLLRAAERLPRMMAAGLRLAAHFPVHSHLATREGIDSLLAETAAPELVPQAELPAVARRVLKADRATMGRAVREDLPYAAMRTVNSGGPHGVTVDGIPSVMLAANDYLGLRWHPKVLEDAERALRIFGSGASGSRLMAGSLSLHKELEEELASFLRREAVLLFPSGYQANVGVLSTLLNRNDVAICDEGVHASLLDGCRMAHATVRRFSRHRPDTLGRILAAVDDGRYPASALVADAVYSMDGDTFPLAEFLVRLDGRTDPLVLVDEAHAVGVLGDDGRGLTASVFGGDRVHLVTGNLSKALASSGGFVAGPADLVASFSFLSRSSLFSTAGTPAALGAALSALRLAQEEPERRVHVHALAGRLRAGLRELGIDTGNSDSPIVPCVIGDEQRTIRLAHALGERGICVGCAVAPAVPRNRAILRMSVSASLTTDDIDRTLETLADLLRHEPMVDTTAGSGG